MNQRFHEPVPSPAPQADAPRLAMDSDRPAQILRFLRDGMRDGTPGALVTLTEITGGAARPLGAHMAVLRDGRYSGMVSGGCVEAAVAREALDALDQGQDRLKQLAMLDQLGTHLDKYMRSFIVQAAFKMCKGAAEKYRFEVMYEFMQDGFLAMKPLKSAEKFVREFTATERNIIDRVHAGDPQPFR